MGDCPRVTGYIYFYDISLLIIQSQLRVVAVIAVDRVLTHSMAQNRQAFASSVWYDADFGGYYWPTKAVDAGYDTNALQDHNTCFISISEYNPWWAVDIGVPCPVVGIMLTNRGDSGNLSVQSSSQKNLGS